MSLPRHPGGTGFLHFSLSTSSLSSVGNKKQKQEKAKGRNGPNERKEKQEEFNLIMEARDGSNVS